MCIHKQMYVESKKASSVLECLGISPSLRVGDFSFV